MKIAYQHLLKYLPSNPSIEEVSEKLFQLGHEHEINSEIFDIEFTPNRGDCLSINGVLRDLNAFYDIKFDYQLYDENIGDFSFEFENQTKDSCSHITFLKIDISDDIKPFKGDIESYFNDLVIKKNNFFTDISNYISYETGQPTHCYDAKKINGKISLSYHEGDCELDTLLGKKIKLSGKNLVFLDEKNKIINLAGVVGDKSTSCSHKTRSVIVECANFNPVDIIGKNVKYDINSEAAHKFERGVDPLCHDRVLRRFLRIVSQHTEIKKAEITSLNFKEFNKVKILYDYARINKILGTNLSDTEISIYLSKIGFKIENEYIYAPSHRNDILNINDISEELARIIGYNNIEQKPVSINIPEHPIPKYNKSQTFIKRFLINKGFNEVINNPFIKHKTNNSIHVVNPLDSNRQYLRTDLKNSLLENLIYNEKRQKDSIKLFEISDVYFVKNDEISSKKVIGIICSGRVGKNYKNFSKKINLDYLKDIMNMALPDVVFDINVINRDNLDTKIKNNIIYLEFDLSILETKDLDYEVSSEVSKKTYKYEPISEFPSSFRDLSFSIKDQDDYYQIQKIIFDYQNELLKDVFIFDYFINEKSQEIKLGFRFVFQSKLKTITEKDVSEVLKEIIDKTLILKSVSIPGI